ncbi:hypothetical protein BH24ACT23_BH24ACT23_10450 [soil metagenome]
MSARPASRRAPALYAPRPVPVKPDGQGRPASVSGVVVSSVREEWLVEDRWWTPRPIERHYFELVLADGRCEVIFCEDGRWLAQRA